jgi:hypothetical protein
MYIEAQMVYQRIVTDQAWTQPGSAQQQEGAVLKANIGKAGEMGTLILKDNIGKAGEGSYLNAVCRIRTFLPD